MKLTNAFKRHLRLRHDLLNPHIKKLTSFGYLQRHGAFLPKVRPVFPAEDYPVWTSLATGLYPEEHNIIGDVMFNLRTREFFNRSDVDSTRNGEWWRKVRPFWSTAAQYGRKVSSGVQTKAES